MELFAQVWSLLVISIQAPAVWPWIQDGFALECIYLLGFIPKLYFIYQLRPGSFKCNSLRRSAVFMHWIRLVVWILIGTILIWTGLNRTYIGKIFIADAILTVVLTANAVINLDHKAFVADRDEMSLTEQYDRYFKDSGIHLNDFIKIYETIASILGYDVLYLRPTDQFCDYWDGLDLFDLFVGLSRHIKIAPIQEVDVIGRLGGVESIVDFVHAYHSVLKEQN